MNVITKFSFLKSWDAAWNLNQLTLRYRARFWEISVAILGFQKILSGNAGLQSCVFSVCAVLRFQLFATKRVSAIFYFPGPMMVSASFYKVNV